MGEKSNKYIEVAYQLYDTTNGELELVEEATAEKPFKFISGFGTTLETFEENITKLGKDGDFDFTLTPDDAYGDIEEERVLDLDKEIFSINGHFDHDNIYKDAIVPLQNEDGNQFMGHVLDVLEDTVKIDLNHPLAGKTLVFKGKVIENREATNDEIQSIINGMGGGCSCGNCDCDGGEHDCGCGSCGHCH